MPENYNESNSTVTQLLVQIASGSIKARNRFTDLLYPDLKSIATKLMRHERLDHTLTPTALVNEGFIKMFGKPRPYWGDIPHFISASVCQMSRVLTDHARRRRAGKRPQTTSVDACAFFDVADPCVDIELELQLKQAAKSVKQHDPLAAAVLELRIRGFSQKEISQTLKMSLRDVQRKTKMAQDWVRDHVIASRLT